MVEVNQLICQSNLSDHAGDVERDQHYAIADTRKCLEQGVAGDPFLVWICFSSCQNQTNLKVAFYSLDNNYTAVFCCQGALALVLKGGAP